MNPNAAKMGPVMQAAARRAALRRMMMRQQQQAQATSGGGGGGGGDSPQDNTQDSTQEDPQGQDPSRFDPQNQPDQPAGEFGDEPTRPAEAYARKIVERLHRERVATAHETVLLYPNKHDALPIERYTLSVIATNPDGSPNPIVGTVFIPPPPQALSGHQAPDVNFRPQRLTTNSPGPGFITMSMGKVANVNFISGGSIDAWQWNANAVGSSLDLPTLTPADNASFSAFYTGATLGNYIKGVTAIFSFQFVMSASGPATITGLLGDDGLIDEPA